MFKAFLFFFIFVFHLLLFETKENNKEQDSSKALSLLETLKEKKDSPLQKPQTDELIKNKKSYFYYKDDDLDGYGKAGTRTPFPSPTPPKGYADNDIDRDDHNDSLLSNEEDEDCDGVYAYDDCDDDDELFQDDTNGDKRCDGMQFFLNKNYLIQIETKEDTFSYLTLSSKSVLSFERFFLSQNLEDDDYSFQIFHPELKENKLYPIPTRKRLQEPKKLYLFSADKRAFINREADFEELITVGRSNRKWGKLITKETDKREENSMNTDRASILLELANGDSIKDLEVDPSTTSCPQGKWCSEVFFIRFPQDENRWLGYSLKKPNYLLRTRDKKQRVPLRLLKNIPE